MPASDNHVILNHIDAPTRILFWSATEFICCFVPIIFGLFIGQIGVGLGLSIISIICFKSFQKRFGRGKVAAILYWHFPSIRKNKIPPSHIRLFLK